MSGEERFQFDLKGWVCIPGVLSEDLIETCREYALLIHHHPERLDEVAQEKPSLTGPLGDLVDHPVLVGLLDEIIGPMSLALESDTDDEFYAFRCESSFSMCRSFSQGRWEPHCGNRGTGPHDYRCENGKIYSGQTRAVWELNPVGPGDGGTQFLSGTHKRNFPIPETYKREGSPLFESYTCPPGSLVVFCERVMHSGVAWQNRDRPRIAVFNCYNHVEAQVHKMNLSHEFIASLPPRRRTLFRGVWNWWNRNEGALRNTYYNEDNRSE